MDRIVFVFLCGPSEEITPKLSWGVSHEDGTVLVPEQPPGDIAIKKSESSQFALGIANVLFPKTGAYLFTLKADGETVFPARFRVEQGSAEDFRS